MTTTQSNTTLKTVVICAIVSAAVSATTSYMLQRGFPLTHNVRVVSEEGRFHLDTFRKDYPPYAYKVDYWGYTEEHRAGFLNLQKIPTIWIYRISIANLAKLDLDNVEVTVKYKKDAKWLLVSPGLGKIRLGPKKDLPTEHWTDVTNKNKEFTVSLYPLAAGTAKWCFLGIVSSDRPSPEAIQVTVQCPEGKFTQLTPVQWERIGWEKK
ncbi:MAG: hypothetical protein SVV80_13385 [Planctomycetota bacterium]|nr:hypothetical protein [Planctomycetota bacterium]